MSKQFKCDYCGKLESLDLESSLSRYPEGWRTVIIRHVDRPDIQFDFCSAKCSVEATEAGTFAKERTIEVKN